MIIDGEAKLIHELVAELFYKGSYPPNWTVWEHKDKNKHKQKKKEEEEENLTRKRCPSYSSIVETIKRTEERSR